MTLLNLGADYYHALRKLTKETMANSLPMIILMS